jgi:hypothetical protein
MKSLFKKARIFREQVKDRHTAHWDLDMLSREELEAVMSQGQQNNPAGTENNQNSGNHRE